jgi:hypothetical protein
MVKTLCAWDNVACIVDNFPQSLDPVTLAFVAILGGIGLASLVATIWKGL